LALAFLGLGLETTPEEVSSSWRETGGRFRMGRGVEIIRGSSRMVVEMSEAGEEEEEEARSAPEDWARFAKAEEREASAEERVAMRAGGRMASE